MGQQTLAGVTPIPPSGKTVSSAESERMVSDWETKRELGDRELIERVRSGRRDDYRFLVDRYKDMVFAMIMRQVNNRETAEELAQDAFVRAYQHLSQFRFESSFSTWLVRIALNLTKNWHASGARHKARRTESLEESRLQEQAVEPEAPVREERRILAKTLRAALSAIKPAYRDVLVLCALEGKSYDEVAAIMKVPVGTIRSRLHKARLLVKDYFVRAGVT